MKKKILVTTDLSVNSKAGIRFGIQLGRQTGFSIIFYSGLKLDQPTRWNNARFQRYLTKEIAHHSAKMNRFVNSVYKDEGIRPGNSEMVVENVRSVQEGIINCGIKKRVDFICLSTRGAGKMRRILGTNTSSIVKNSPIPVLAIPRNYHSSLIDHILYASDLNALPEELRKVKKFATLVNSKVTVLHFDYLFKLEEVKRKFDKIAARRTKPGVKFELEQFNIEHSLSTHLKNAVKRFNPSVVVLFTRRERDWFDRLFFSSKSAEASFDSKKPLLIYGKRQ